VAGPAVFGALIQTGSRGQILLGYLLGGGLMLLAAVAELVWGVAAERAPLEEVAPPLSLADADDPPASAGAPSAPARSARNASALT
jgi:hypothetical protein